MKFLIVSLLIVVAVSVVVIAEQDTHEIRAKRRDMFHGDEHIYLVHHHEDRKSEEKDKNESDKEHHMTKRDKSDAEDEKHKQQSNDDHMDPIPHSRLSVFP